jgi:hypothetical protein
MCVVVYQTVTQQHSYSTAKLLTIVFRKYVFVGKFDHQ